MPPRIGQILIGLTNLKQLLTSKVYDFGSGSYQYGILPLLF